MQVCSIVRRSLTSFDTCLLSSLVPLFAFDPLEEGGLAEPKLCGKLFSTALTHGSYLCLQLSPFGLSSTWLTLLSCTSSQTWSRSACPSNFQLLVLPLFSGWILIIWFVVSVILYQFLYSLCFDLIGFVIVVSFSHMCFILLLYAIFKFLSGDRHMVVVHPLRSIIELWSLDD